MSDNGNRETTPKVFACEDPLEAYESQEIVPTDDAEAYSLEDLEEK